MLDTSELTILSCWAEAVADALAFAPEQLETVRADALADAPWRAELDLPEPSGELNQAISRMFREARTAMDTGREPPLDAVILAVRATHVGSPGLDQLVCRVLRSAVKQRRNRRPTVGEALPSTDESELTREPADDIGRKGLVEAQDELLNPCVCIGCDAFANRLRRTDQSV